MVVLEGCLHMRAGGGGCQWGRTQQRGLRRGLVPPLAASDEGAWAGGVAATTGGSTSHHHQAQTRTTGLAPLRWMAQ